MQKNNKMCKKNNKMYKKRKQKTVYWDLINSNVNKRDDENVMIFTVDNGSCECL